MLETNVAGMCLLTLGKSSGALSLPQLSYVTVI